MYIKFIYFWTQKFRRGKRKRFYRTDAPTRPPGARREGPGGGGTFWLINCDLNSLKTLKIHKNHFFLFLAGSGPQRIFSEGGKKVYILSKRFFKFCKKLCKMYILQNDLQYICEESGF